MRELSEDAELRDLLERARSIAVLGIKAGERDDAFRVPRYMQQHGYRIFPVNPKLERVLEEYRTGASSDAAAVRKAIELGVGGSSSK